MADLYDQYRQLVLNQPPPMGPPPPMMAPPTDMPQNPLQAALNASPAHNPAQVAGPSQLDKDKAQQAQMAGQKAPLESVYSHITHSDFGQNHPILGKIAGVAGQIPATIGDIAASAILPRIGAMIPGTSINRGLKEQGLERRIGEEEKQQQEEAQTNATNAEIPLRQAEAKKATTEAENEPAALSEKTKLEDAQIQNLLHPQAKTAFEDWRKTNPDAPTTDFFKAEQAAKPEKADPMLQQYVDEYQKTHPGATLAQALHQHAIDVQPPQRPPIVNVAAEREHEGQDYVVPDGKGGHTLMRIYPGQAIPEGAQTQAGMNAVNTPTTQQRTAAGRAATVVAMAPEVLHEIDHLGPQLGPVMGRWNDFMQGKVGMENPEFAGLRTDLVMLSSAVALAHAVGRLPENLRLEFDHMINAPQQTPDNIKSVIQHVLPWLQKMQEQGNPGANRQAGGPPEGADVKVKGKDGKTYWGNSKTKQVYGEVTQ